MCVCDILSGLSVTCSDILSGMLSGIYSDILPGKFGLSFWHAI